MDEDKNQNKPILPPGQSQRPEPIFPKTNDTNVDPNKTDRGTAISIPRPLTPPSVAPPLIPSSSFLIPKPISRFPAPPSIPAPPVPKPEIKPETKQQESKSSDATSSKGTLTPSSISSSIRTMQGDIQALIKGKTPSGEQLEKKPISVPKISVPTPPPSPPLSPPPIPNLPQIKSPIVKLGELQKAKPLAPPSVFTPFSMASDKKEIPSTITIPSSSFSVNNRSLMLYALLAGAIAGGIYYIFFASKERTIPVSQSTPTPIISKSPLPGQSFVLKSSGNPFSQISIFVANQRIPQEKVKLFTIVNELGDSYNFQELAGKILINPPPALFQNLSADKSHLFIYGQKEYFGDIFAPTPTPPAPPPKRYGFIVEVASDVNLIANLAGWEDKMASDFEKVFEFKTSDASAPDFLDNVHENTNVRYRNFPTPDKTIDYAVAVDFRGKKYLVFANSREAIFNVVDNINKIFSNLKE